MYTNHRHRDAGWPNKPIQLTLHNHFQTPQTLDNAPNQQTTTSTLDSNLTISDNNTTTTTTTNPTTTGIETYNCSLRWLDENFNNLINSLPPVDLSACLNTCNYTRPTATSNCGKKNINKSLLSQQDLLISLKRNNYNICTIQEPYIDQNGLSRANYQWFTVYPSTHTTAPEATRSILLINTNLLTNDWKQILIPHPDIIAIKLTGTFGKIQLLNIYNNRDNNDTLKHITTFMSANSPVCSPTTLTHYMWLGDFNYHHPLWGELLRFPTLLSFSIFTHNYSSMTVRCCGNACISHGFHSTYSSRLHITKHLISTSKLSY